MSTINEQIGKKIKALRIEKGLTQTEFANLFNLTQNTVTNIETGKRTLYYEELLSMANYFDVSTDYLIKENGVREKKPEMQYICDYTGLSPDAVKVLNDYTDYAKGASNVLASLNKLIEGAKELPSERFFNIIGDLPEQRNVDLREEDAEYNKKGRNNVLIDIAAFFGYEIQEEKTFSIDYFGGVHEGTNPFSDLRNIVTNKELFDRIMLDRITEKLKALQEDFFKMSTIENTKE